MLSSSTIRFLINNYCPRLLKYILSRGRGKAKVNHYVVVVLLSCLKYKVSSSAALAFLGIIILFPRK